MSNDDQGRFLEALEHLEGRGYEFEGFLSNHGPMASDALVAMGEADTVVRWADLYRNNLSVEPEQREALSDVETSWRPALGQFERVADWRELFRHSFAEAPWTEVLARWWPRLLPGLAAAATHGVIRTAHAVRAIDRSSAAGAAAGLQDAAAEDLLIDELAHGLAYWAARFQPLPGGVPGLTGAVAPDDLVNRIAAFELTEEPDAPGIIGTLLKVDTIDGFSAALDDFGVGNLSPDEAIGEVTRQAARSFVVHPGPPIALVHSLTGPAAVRMVLPHLPADQHVPSLAMSWKVSAAIIATNAGLVVGPPDTALDHDELIGRAVEHGDEHVIKMTEACIREHTRNPDPVYLQAAEKSLGLIDPPSWRQ